MREVHESHDVFFQDTFTEAFVKDLRRARGLVIIQSPFMTARRINEVGAAIRNCVRRGVRVCVFAQEAFHRGKKPATEEERARAKAIEDAREEARQLLIEMGVHVTFRKSIHEKLAVIDEHIVWEGSLNILSVDKTFERMNRWESRPKVEEVTAKHKLDTCGSCRDLFISKNGQSTDRELLGIGADVADRRKLLRFSQHDVSNLSRLTQCSISRIEVGRRNAKLITLVRMCRALRCEIRIIPKFLLSAVDELLARCQSDR